MGVLNGGFKRRSREELAYDINILITEKVWEEDEAPKVGDDIEGRVWLEGKLTSISMK